MEFRNAASLLVFANTAVEQDRASARVQHKRLNGQHQSVPRCVDVVGFQQSAREFDRVRCDSWKEIGDGKLEAVDVDDDVHKVVARLESHRVTRPTSAAGLSDARVPRMPGRISDPSFVLHSNHAEQLHERESIGPTKAGFSAFPSCTIATRSRQVLALRPPTYSADSRPVNSDFCWVRNARPADGNPDIIAALKSRLCIAAQLPQMSVVLRMS